MRRLGVGRSGISQELTTRTSRHWTLTSCWTHSASLLRLTRGGFSRFSCEKGCWRDPAARMGKMIQKVSRRCRARPNASLSGGGGAEAAGGGHGTVEFLATNIMDYDPRSEGPWDLVVLSETIYYLGWLYSFFDVAWLSSELFAASGRGGRLLMANTCGGGDDGLLHPWLIRTYRDLFLNVGYRLEIEEVFRGTKNGVDFEVLISLFAKAPAEISASAGT